MATADLNGASEGRAPSDSSPGEQAPSPTQPPLVLDYERASAGLECTWEAEALIGFMQEVVEGIQQADEEDVRRNMGFRLRGLMARTHELNSLVMSILGDDTGVPTKGIELVLEGRRHAY